MNSAKVFAYSVVSRVSSPYRYSMNRSLIGSVKSLIAVSSPYRYSMNGTVNIAYIRHLSVSSPYRYSMNCSRPKRPTNPRSGFKSL